MSPLDLSLIALYILGVTLFGAYVGASSKGLKGYFLGGGDVPALAVMISIVATETSTATFLSVPTLAFREGGDFTYLQLAIGYILARVVVATVLLPSYFKGQIMSAYEVLSMRFGGATKTVASVLFLVSRTLGDGLRLFLAAVVLRELLELGGVVGEGAGRVSREWSMPLAIVLMGASTIVYTYLGGMKAVVWTDVTQFVVYMLGAFVALGIMVGRIDGGFDAVLAYGREHGKFRLINAEFDLTQNYTIWAGVIGGLFLSTATHGADQMMVQRYLAARSKGQAAGALVASGFVVLAQFAVFLLIGVGLAALYAQSPPERTLKADQEFAYFVVRYLPTGLLGLVVAAIFSAAMSTLSSSLNASSSSTINDLIRPARPDLSEDRLVVLSRLLTVAWGLAQMGIAYVAAVAFADSPVVEGALAIASYVTGIILGVFLLGILTRRVDQRAALVGLLVGLTAVSYAKFGPRLPGRLYPFDGALAWPYFALVGSTTTFVAGLLASYLLPSLHDRPETEPR